MSIALLLILSIIVIQGGQMLELFEIFNPFIDSDRLFNQLAKAYELQILLEPKLQKIIENIVEMDIEKGPKENFGIDFHYRELLSIVASKGWLSESGIARCRQFPSRCLLSLLKPIYKNQEIANSYRKWIY